MRVAVDVMGGDHGSGVVIEGARLALQANGGISALFLVGDQDQIQAELDRARYSDPRIKIVHTTEVLTMEDKPTDVLRRKKDSSMARAVELVRTRDADAIISLGNTGGLVTAATVKLRPLELVDRPAIATVIPTPEREFLLLDAGANAECKPMHLVQFAIMGSIYSREILRHERPRVGILSNGTEAMKGTDLTRDACRLCEQLDLNFLGYIEGHDLFEGEVDVVVTDGFVGNIVLKTCESMGRAIKVMLERELTRNPLRLAGAGLAYGGIRSIKRRMNPDTYGGAPLLGLNGNVIKAHGSARAQALMNAIRVAVESVRHHINDMIQEAIARANERVAAAA
ncbi:MAG TPA: phosphate acyltransferase PlsX [Methylomirabilota bacterium]|nr:phosphate acyltransferase PlsX [Methylomirabilota bacterium]